jgi:hypothetical protein
MAVRPRVGGWHAWQLSRWAISWLLGGRVMLHGLTRDSERDGWPAWRDASTRPWPDGGTGWPR